jgi:2-dehydrotetronate isomerase
MTAFSANLGFLWTALPLPAAIRAAAAAGFAAVECHCPYDFAPEEIKAALDDTGLAMLGLNTERGNVAAGDNGLAAVPGREREARDKIDQAIDYAVAINAGNVHVMAGRAEGRDALAAYLDNLRHACTRAEEHGINILIEPLNPYDAPGYFLKTTEKAVEVIGLLGRTNLRLMFDCYHVQITEGDICRRFDNLIDLIGHVQIAAVPDRGEPDHGEVDYSYVLEHMARRGYQRPIGAEYRPISTVEAGLGWLEKFSAI